MSVERISAVWETLPSCYIYTICCFFFLLFKKKISFTTAMLFKIYYFLLHIALSINLFLVHVSWERDSILIRNYFQFVSKKNKPCVLLVKQLSLLQSLKTYINFTFHHICIRFCKTEQKYMYELYLCNKII